ncbi:hypothetical protein I8J29_32040 [Paenibacillus sp. MWE-103]|uniref:Uncharacterized protein n=1 Tax=Paenibacillus artemisiicola TaxID=1172618 RepID=A0ABS3WKI1_9BACL|nr:hypothetical protein [Paenibacillus artemisiicola]MBO7748812.1 hypothetical protein [Paenibacillus artemisiicola]
MPNQIVFDQSNGKFFGKLANTYAAPGIVAPPDYDAAAEAREFAVSFVTSSTLGLLGGSVTAAVQIANPAGSGRTLYVSRIAGGVGIALNLLSSFSDSVALARGGTIASPAALTPVNTRLGSGAASVMTARSSASAISGGTNFFACPINAGMFSADYGGALVVPPNQSLSMTVSASLSVAGILSCFANALWWEG